MEDERLLVGDMLLDDLVISRMNADDVLDDRVATYERRNGIEELTALAVNAILEVELVAGAESHVTLAVEGLVDGQVQRLDYA